MKLPTIHLVRSFFMSTNTTQRNTNLLLLSKLSAILAYRLVTEKYTGLIK
jgi:hypothetical protein